MADKFGMTRRELGRTGLRVSPLGFGGYRIQAGVAGHEAALKKALQGGCNLIDTSTNYGDGASEVLVGQVVRDLIASGGIRREDLVVVSKIGYVQGENLELVRVRESQGKPYPDVVEYSADCWHCISPEFLADQLTLSLGRLEFSRLDILLLHNPEYFLKTSGDHAEYYQRIRRAFVHLESEVKRGRIAWYGISSNSLPAPKESDEFTSLEAVLEIAAEIGAKHFGVIQFPMNLLEPGAALEPNCREGSLLALAKRENIGTLVNRPLNGFAGNTLIRLADYPDVRDRDPQGLITAVREDLARTIAWEATLPRTVTSDSIGWGHILSKNLSQIRDLDFWKHVLSRQIEPALAKAWPTLPAPWAEKHQALCETLFLSIRRLLESQAGEKTRPIRRKAEALAPALQVSPTLSRQALRVYLGLPGVHSVLLGMREDAYVDDAMGMEPPLPAEDALRVMENAGRLD